MACKLEISQLVKPNCINLARGSENLQSGVPDTSQHCQLVTGFSLFCMSKILAIIIFCDTFSVNSLQPRLLMHFYSWRGGFQWLNQTVLPTRFKTHNDVYAFLNSSSQLLSTVSLVSELQSHWLSELYMLSVSLLFLFHKSGMIFLRSLHHWFY